jgi:hypothetical protein
MAGKWRGAVMGTDFVTIADNANPIDVLVYRRAAQVQGSRLVCKVPVFERTRAPPKIR